MKRIVILIAVLAFTVSMTAQKEDAIAKYFSSYADSEDYTKVTISSKMFELFTHIEGTNEEEQEMLETISGLQGMRMVTASNPDEADSRYKSALKSLGSEFEVLMEVEDDEENITIFIKEESGMINELVIIGCGDEFFILSLLGDIDLKQVAKLSRTIQIDGMEHLQNIDEE